jgi:hypothetical protein
LRAICIPSRVEILCQKCFSSCHSLGSVAFESACRVCRLEDRSFRRCHALGSIELPDSVEIIGRNCFTGCYKLHTVRIGSDSRLLRVEQVAFCGCKKLGSLLIPGRCEFIDGSTFFGSSVTDIEISVDNCLFRTWNSFLFDVSRPCIVRYFGDESTITIPNSVETIGRACFAGFGFPWGPRIRVVIFEKHSKVRELRSSAFEEYDALITICIPSSVGVIGRRCFAGCNHLRKVRFGSDSHLVRIEMFAFEGCSSLRSICIPSSVREIESCCFSRCFALKDLIFERGCEAMRLYRMACRCPLVGRHLLWTVTEPSGRCGNVAVLFMGFVMLTTTIVLVLCLCLVFKRWPH